MDALCSYLPASILSYLLEHEGKMEPPPLRQVYKTAVLFADISGYSALCERVAEKGAVGDEYLAKHLNSYFEQLVKIMSSQGGDVFKFAGDAVIVLWPPSSDESLQTLTRRAAQCGLEIKRGLQNVTMAEGITLSVKIGVGVGEISILHVGGVFGRMEYVATGMPLIQAFEAEHHCDKPDVIVSPEAWELIRDHFEAEINDRHAFLKKCAAPLKKVSVFKTTSANKNIEAEVLKNVGKYVPSAVLPFINHHEERWASELRRITVLFVNLGMKEKDINMIATNPLYINVVHDVLQAVQTAVYKYEGSLNKFLLDDKGSTLIAVFGLAPLAHEDDSVRGILASLAICAKLGDLGFKPSIGVTTGMAFCGVVGSRGRREYSVLGDTVNLSARLMQHATKEGGGVICDTSTQYSARHRLHFEELGRITVKGKLKPVQIWQPYSKLLAPLYQSKETLDSSHVDHSNISHMPHATALANPLSPSSSILQPIPIDGASIVPTPALSRVVSPLSSANLALVDDETLHLRRKSQSLDPLQLVKPAGSSPANPSASPPKLNGTTSDTIQPEAVVAAADGGSAAARAVDALIAEEMSTPPGNKLVRRSSIEARSTFTRRNADGTVVVPTLNTWNANAPHQLMLEIHNFQMEGSVKRHFALVKSRKERRQTLTGKADNNSMDAAVHSSSPHAASADDLSLPVPQTVSVSDNSLPTTPQTLALSIASSVSISGSNSSYSPAALAFNSHLAFEGQRVVFDNVAEGVAPAPEDFAMAYPELARSRRVRGVKVLLPDGLGSLNLSTTHMDSILQLKEELSILCRKRLLLPPAATQLDYFLCLENEQWWGPEAQLPVSSETGENPARVLDAPGCPTGIDEVLGPVMDYMQQQREQWKKKNVAHLQLSENEPASPIAQQTIPEDPPSYPSSFLAESDLVSLSMCRTLPEYLIDVLPRKMHDVLCHHIGRLVQERRGGTVVIEGLVGLGKTRLMFGALEYMQKMQSETPSQNGSSASSSPTTNGNGNSSSPTNGNTNNIQVLCALANPFEIHKPLSVWRDVFLTAIDSELDRNDEEARLAYPGGSNGSSSQVRANRRKFVESKLKLRRSIGREGLHLLAPVLNEVLQLEIEETEVTKDLDSAARIAHAQNLLLVLMHMFVNPTSNTSSSHHASNSSLSSPRFVRQPSSPSQLVGNLNLNGSVPASNVNPSVIVCIDDAIFLDSASWHLLLRMSRQLPNLLIMLATRPMNRTYQAAFVSGGVPPDFTALIHEPQTTYLVMRSRSDEVIEQIACEALIKNMPQPNEPEASESVAVVATSITGTGSASSPSSSPSYLAPFSATLTPLVNCPPKDQVLPELPPALAHLILKKAHGSPLVVLELVYNLRKDRLVVVTYDKSPSPISDSSPRTATIHVDPSFNLSQVHNNPSIPVPITLQCILGCRIDRLSHIQRMILKCCAIIGDEFSFALIARVYPLALENPEADLRRELKGLIELQILQVNDSSDSNRPGSSKASFDDEDAVTHSFRDGFMREMFLSRMLEKQKFDLDEKVSEARLELFRKKAERISKSLVPNHGNRPSSIGPFVTPILCGVLYIRDTPPVVKRTTTDDANNHTNGNAPASASGSSSSGSVTAAAGKNTPSTLEYRLRYFALCDSLLLGWTTEEAFLDRKDPLCIYSLEEASTCDDPSRDFGFAVRSLVSLEQFSEYSQTPRIVRFAALNEKEYESWGVKLHEQIRERLLLDQPQPSITGGAAAGLTVSTGLPSGASGLIGIAEEPDADGGKPRSGSISLIMNPLLAASNAVLLNAALPPATPAAPSPSHHSHPSFVIPPAGNKLGDKGSDDDKPSPLDINNMSAAEKETLSKKFISAVENRMAPAVLPQQLLYVKKYRAGESIASAKAAAANKSSSSSSGSLFSSEWKQRYVSLIGEALLLRDKKFDSGHEWTRPTQCFSLSLGSPQASIAANPSDAYDASKKVYKLMLEVDMWMKGSSVAWSRRAVVLGCSTYAEAKRLCEKITDVIFANQVAQTQANKQKHQRASTWGNFKTTTTRKGLDMGGPGAGGPSGSRPSVMNTMPGTPVRGALALPRPSLNLSAANAGQRGINGLNLAGSGSPATTSTPTLKPHVSFGSSVNSDDDRRLRASQRQLGQAPSSPSANAGNLELNDRAAAASSPLFLPATDDSLTGTSVAAPLALNTVGMDEERQLDQLFSDALVNISPASGNPDQLQQLFQLLKAKVKSVAKTTRQRMLHAVAGLEKPGGSAAFKRVPSNSDLADSDSNEAEHESTTSTNWGEQLTNCDLDDTTRSWLQINWTNEPSSRNSSGIAKAEKEELDKSEERNRNKIAVQAQAAAAAAAAAANGKPDSPTAPSSTVVAASGATASIPLSVSKKPIGDLTSWEWNIFDYATDSFDLLPIVVEIFQSFRFIEVYSITPGIFQSWLNEVYANYFENSYHSFHHAVDVLQTVYSILTTHGAQVYLTTLEKFSLCIAALCHDVRHPGLTNSYHITARTPVAMLYNDQSVLEHHHCATTFKILSNPPTNILSKLTPNEYRTVRGRLTLGILSTDMTCHFTLIEKFNGFLDEQARLPININAASQTIQTADELTDNARSVIFNVLLHACDISNPSKPWPVQRKWSDAVLNEFLLQGDKEKEKGFPISPNCDRRNTDQALLSLNFIDFIVAPIFVSLRNLLPTVQYICVLIKENRTQWTKIFTSNLENNKDMPSDEKQAELARATRRTESFHEIMLPPEDVSRRLSKEVENGANSTNPATTAPNSPGTTQPSSTGAVGVTPAGGTLNVTNHSSPLSSTSPRRVAGGSPSPLNDPRRNSLMALKKFVTANSKSNLKLPTARASILVPHNGQLNHGNGNGTPSRPLSPAHAATSTPSTTSPTSPMTGHASTTPQVSVATGLISTTPATSPTTSKGVMTSPTPARPPTSAVGVSPASSAAMDDQQEEEVLITSKSVPLVAPHSAVAPRLPQSPTTHLP